MAIFRKLRKLVRSGFRSLDWRNRQVPEQPILGLPPGLSFGSLNEICLLHTNHALRRAWYLPLSHWKSTCATYRLLIQPERGRLWKLIYKDAQYQRHQAALAGLPVSPGPPEYLVYANARGPLTRFLPTVYLFQEVVRGEHYQYLLEDLGDAYQKKTRPENLVRAGKLVPEMHEAMRQWLELAEQKDLLLYDSAFTQGLLDYAQTTLDRYCMQVESIPVSDFCQNFSEIAGAYNHLETELIASTCPIHGDFNITNLMFHKKKAGLVKILDWEWAGLGLPHADLASLLNWTDAELEETVLVNYSARVKDRPLREHRRIYDWCKLQRGLLDASFTALHVMENPNLAGFDRQKFIITSLQHAQQAVAALRS